MHAQYLQGIDLYNGGLFWEAHEVWEAQWRAAERGTAEHEFLQGLIQCAAACLKAARHETAPARRIATRALARLEQVRDDAPAGTYMGIELGPFCAEFRSFISLDPPDVERRPRIVLGDRLSRLT